MTTPLVLELWPGATPGSEDWTRQERGTRSEPHGHLFIRNITKPSISVFLPDTKAATGAAVVVCPGGAFHFVSFENEGTNVAEWLAARGIAAFVLKYRVAETPADDEAFVSGGRSFVTEDSEAREKRMAEITREIAPLAVADAQQALKLIRRHASEWGVDPNRLGVIGFSAGGRVAVSTALEYDSETRPAFAGAIYGALYEHLNVPSDAPPMFIALADDDPIAVQPSMRLYQAWHAARKPVELHIYAHGQHGFGMVKQGLPSDSWIERLSEWLVALGILETSRA